MVGSVGESSVQHHREIDVNLSGDTVELPDLIPLTELTGLAFRRDSVISIFNIQ